MSAPTTVTAFTDADRRLDERTAVVTGAASGIGRAVGHTLAALGARVALFDVSSDVDEVAAALIADGGTAGAWSVDVSDAGACARALTEVTESLGPVDVLVNNAGVSIPAPVDAEDFEEAWQRTMAVNLTAQIRLIRLCVADLVRSGAGRIVNVASTEGLGASAYISPYTASKHGVVGLTRALAVELGPRGVTVNCVCPGPIHTGMTAPIPAEAKDKFARRRVPLRRYGNPHEVAEAVGFLTLPVASYVNGAILPVDGGMTAQNT